MKCLVVSLLILKVGFYSTVKSQLDEACTTTAGQLGKCTLVKSCAYVLDIIRDDYRTKEELLYTENNICGYTAEKPPKPLICCPVVYNVKGCGVEIANRIVGGSVTPAGMFPWTGVIVYRDPSRDERQQLKVHCGCSLLNSRWVLTVAHCIVIRREKIHHVRFNEWNIYKKRNCTFYNDTEICRQEYEVEGQFVHPDYRSDEFHYDIGLLKTKTDVEFNDYVIPICLPLPEKIQKLQMSEQEFIVTGFGETNQGNQPGLQRHVTVKGRNLSECQRVYAEKRITLTENQMCAGGKEGEDSCHGDSGGPLMLEDGLVRYLVGLVSFGAPKCAEKDKPAVYTNVIKYLDWIEEVMAQN